MKHIGIVGCSAEGAALCYRTLCVEGAQFLGPHGHPEVSMHTPSLADYMACIYRGDWQGVGEIMLASAHKLAAAGADFLICPDNTIHQAFDSMRERSPLPWLHIAEVVAQEAAQRGMRRVGLTGTQWLVESEVYPAKLSAHGIDFVRPAPQERAEINRFIMDELVCERFTPECVACLQRVIARFQGPGLRRRGAGLHRTPAGGQRRQFALADAGFDALAGTRGLAPRAGLNRAARAQCVDALAYDLLAATLADCATLNGQREETAMPSKNTICLWYDGTALEAAQFYARTFPDSAVDAVHRSPGDYPAGKEGDVLTVEFTVMGIPCLGLNGGPQVKHSEAFSFQVATEDQAETDRLWDAIVGNGGQASACGWCKDKWGLSWQITPRVLSESITSADRALARRVFEAMMQMGKIDIAAIEAARRG